MIQKKIMNVPCSVKSWLYPLPLTNCVPGRASSSRISSASRPPTMKKIKANEMYWMPITLWSVLNVK